MITTERIEDINNLLIEHFGINSDNGDPIWRVVFSHDQFEKRLGTFEDRTPNGLYIRTVTEVREVPKYRQWIQSRWVLEQLVIVPEVNSKELAGTKQSYEPLWTFEDKHGNALPPKFEACEFIIQTIYAAMGQGNLAKYKDPEGTQEGALQAQAERVDKIVEDLFGDETDVSDHLSRQTGVVISNTTNLIH